jgi:hypothetical protein
MASVMANPHPDATLKEAALRSDLTTDTFIWRDVAAAYNAARAASSSVRRSPAIVAERIWSNATATRSESSG